MDQLVCMALAAMQHSSNLGATPEPSPYTQADAEEDGWAPGANLDSDALWAVGARGYEAWVCELAHALLSHAPSPTLRMCAPCALAVK